MSTAVARASTRVLRASGVKSAGLLRVTNHPQCLATLLSRYYVSKSYPPHTVVTMPALSPTMTAGNIGTWQKNPGDTIAPGDVLVEIETDKAQMDFEHQEDGVMAKVLLESGSKDVAVGNPIAVLVEKSDDVGAFSDFTAEDAGGAKKPAPPPKEEKLDSSEPDAAKSSSPPPQPESSGERLQTALERESSKAASPRAKALALEKGVPLSAIKGTGLGGRITAADIEAYKPAAGAAGAVGASGYTDIPLTAMRKTIATRLQESKNTSPHYYVNSTLSVSRLLKLRAALNGAANSEYKLSVNDFLIKAVAAALLKVPAVNSSYREADGVIRQHAGADISVAVATPVGLMTPIVAAAHAKGLQAISAEVKQLAGKAREGKLKPEQYQGGTFTISNMGMNDAVDRFTAIINPPQAGILAVGSTKKVAIPGPDGGIAWDDQIVVSGSFDHRVVDGAVGGEFMKALKKVVENPLELLL